jgi:hypothetical protein
MPHRDAPVPEGGGIPPGTEAPDVEDMEADQGLGSGRGQRQRNSGNPMDL